MRGSLVRFIPSAIFVLLSDHLGLQDIISSSKIATQQTDTLKRVMHMKKKNLLAVLFWLLTTKLHNNSYIVAGLLVTILQVFYVQLCHCPTLTLDLVHAEAGCLASYLTFVIYTRSWWLYWNLLFRILLREYIFTRNKQTLFLFKALFTCDVYKWNGFRISK